jgi:hypothetical protein
MFYGASLMDWYRRAATYVDRVRSLSAAVKVLVNQTACIAVWFSRGSGLRPPLLTEPQVSEHEQYDDYDPDNVEDVHDLPASCVISSRFSADRPPFP